MAIIYILLIFIIGLLIKLIYFPIDKGARVQARWNKLFNRRLDISDYKKDDPRNETNPYEVVRMKNGETTTRKIAGWVEATENNLKK